MYNNNYNYPLYSNQYNQAYPISNENDDRIIAGGGFLAPFLLGGIAGAALAPGFGYNRPYYNNYYYYPYPAYSRPYYGYGYYR